MDDRFQDRRCDRARAGRSRPEPTDELGCRLAATVAVSTAELAHAALPATLPPAVSGSRSRTRASFGGFPDGVTVSDGHVVVPELLGIGFEGKADLYRVLRELTPDCPLVAKLRTLGPRS